jgi:hypothetical protein
LLCSAWNILILGDVVGFRQARNKRGLLHRLPDAMGGDEAS